MRPLCKLSSETGVQLVFFHICLIYGIEVNGSEARASTWCAELHYCAAMPLEYLVTMLDHKREPCCKNSSPSRSFLRGRIYGREIPPPALFPFSSSRKTGGGLSRFTRATSLSSTWWNNACVHIPEYVNLYHYVFIVFFPFFFFYVEWRKESAGLVLIHLANYFEFLSNSMSRKYKTC